MPKEVKKDKQKNTQAGPSQRPICQKCKKTGHTTNEHWDNYHPSFTPAASTPKKKSFGKKKKDNKGKGKQHNDTAQVTSIVTLNTDSEDETGYASQTAEAGWSVLTSKPNILTSDSPLVHEHYRKKKDLDDDYAHSQALCAPMYSAYNDDDNYGYKHYTYYKDVTSKSQSPQVSNTNWKGKSCSQPLWLMDSGATDHSTPFMNDFLTYKELQKPVRV